MTSKLLNRRQARWNEFLSRFNFKITYRPGRVHQKVDALTRRTGEIEKDEEERKQFQSQTLLKSKNLDISATEESANLWEEGYRLDPIPNQILRMLQEKVQHSRLISLADCEEIDGKLYYREKLFVPASDRLRLHLIQQHHDTPAMGHSGRTKTLELLSRNYYWSGMIQDVARYIRNCHTCQRSHTARHAPFGLLKPLPIANKPWEEISMDFVTGLPWSEGYDAIWVVVDRFTKMRHLVPCRTTTDASQLAEMFIDRIWRYHGLPNSIVSDRGPQFASKFWSRLCERLQIGR
jgi:hypothetical protein